LNYSYIDYASVDFVYDTSYFSYVNNSELIDLLIDLLSLSSALSRTGGIWTSIQDDTTRLVLIKSEQLNLSLNEAHTNV